MFISPLGRRLRCNHPSPLHLRCRASSVTFEEIFSLANEHECDMVLLTGNLFHENKPSRKALQSAIEVLRTHCLGDREIGMDIVSEQGAALHGKSVNFEDPNYNVQMPCFAIHGDHDDPGGEGGLSALDILSSANLLNYFGKVWPQPHGHANRMATPTAWPPQPHGHANRMATPTAWPRRPHGLPTAANNKPCAPRFMAPIWSRYASRCCSGVQHGEDCPPASAHPQGRRHTRGPLRPRPHAG